jgi:hypothetical protein
VSDESGSAPRGKTQAWWLTALAAGWAIVYAYGDSAAIVAVDDLVSEVGW